jgi:hypothetical protein
LFSLANQNHPPDPLRVQRKGEKEVFFVEFWSEDHAPKLHMRGKPTISVPLFGENEMESC